jgi:diguanylate cyclase (GGDEF)-like protein/PAS domain S-box-containing protein
MNMLKHEIEYLPVATACFSLASGTDGTIPDFLFTDCNSAFKALLGIDVVGKKFSHITGDFSGLFGEIASYAASQRTHFVYDAADSLRFDVRMRRETEDFVVCITDINSDDYLTRVESKNISRALKSISAGIITVSGNGSITLINSAARKLTGWGDDALGMPFNRVLNVYYDNDKLPLPVDIKAHIRGSSESISFGNNILLKKKDGQTFSIDLSVSPVESDNEIPGMVAIFRDSSKDISREKEITYLSYHDKLTGLYNRAFFEKKIREYDRNEFYPISIIIGDTNGLKMTNDVFGHKKGDILLINIANILSLACRESDIIARYGGDEFTVLMPYTTLEEAGKICRNILSLCNDQSCDQNKISISLGYATKKKSTESINDVLNVAEDFMYRHKLLESKSYRSSVISSLKKMLFEKSFETEEHAMRITSLCNEAGRLMGLSQSDLNDLELFSMLHDIGKIGIKDSVLLKPGKLSDDEWVEMRRHCEIGYRIAQSAPELAHIADFILCHHERWDGNGYPQKLSSTQIPLLSRILAVADSYDAMVNDRYYRKALTHEFAIAELKRCSGTQFDPEVVKVFLQILEPHPVEITA